MLGSTGCQSATGRIRRGEPVLFGSLPKISENVRLHTLLRATGCRRQAADDCRLAACALQRMLPETKDLAGPDELAYVMISLHAS